MSYGVVRKHFRDRKWQSDSAQNKRGRERAYDQADFDGRQEEGVLADE